MSNKNKSYLPIYRVENNPETNRDATYVYFSKAQKTSGLRVPAMPKYRTTGNPKLWIPGQLWERATTYQDEEKTQPKWERIYHAKWNAHDVKHPHWLEKAETATTMPKWADFPVFRYNYYNEHWEIKDSPFEEWRQDYRPRQSKNVDHRSFVRLWYSNTYSSVAGLAKHLGWSRAKVINRRQIVQRWLDKWEQHELNMKDKILFTEAEREDWLSQHGAPSAKEIASIAHLFGVVEFPDTDVYDVSSTHHSQ